MIENHTLVIPTYNRPAMLQRLVSYYVKRLGTPNIVVLDSSRPDIVVENAAALAVHGKSVRHARFPADMPMAVKLHHGLGQVATPYVSFCADDDVVFPDGLAKAIDFLEGHPDHVSAHGRYLNFRLRRRRTVDVWVEYAGPGNEASHPGARIFRLFQRYESLFYGMFRLRDLRQIFEAVAVLPTLHYQELFQSVAALIKGKVHRFPDFYAARQSIAPAEPTRQKWQTFYWFAENATELMDHYRKYCAALWQFYEAHGPQPRLNGEAFYRVLDLSHAVYFAKECPVQYFHSVLQPYWPGDQYVDQREDPVLRFLFTWLYRYPRLWRFLRQAYNAVQFGAGSRLRHVRSLNEKVRKTCKTHWVCWLRYEYRSLAFEPNFRNSYLQLCNYLDQS